MLKKYNTEVTVNQDNLLSDLTGTGRERPWAPKKIKTCIVADTYGLLAEDDSVKQGYYNKRANSLDNCGNYLEFWTNPKDEQKKLAKANFCRKRLCPMCAWRRSLKIFGQVSKIMEYLNENNPTARYIFLTLTVENVSGEELSFTIKEMIRAFRNLLKRAKVEKNLLGAYRGIEVTYNEKRDDYHPHIHAILMMKPSYFNSKDNYITQEEYAKLWADCLKLDYKPVCDVRKVRGKTSKAVAEVAKYTVKDDDYVKPEDVETGKKVVAVLDEALHGKRLISFFGEMKKAHAEMNLENIEDDTVDLIHTDTAEDDLSVKGWIKETYAFNVGFMNYTKIK